MSDSRPFALVTGGSSGIGFELARRFAENGHDVAVSGRADRVHDAARALRDLGVEAWACQVDMGTYDGVEEFWAFVRGLDRRIDAACLNVGIGLGGAVATTAALVAVSESLPPRIRSGALAIVYALAISVFGGSTQFVVAKLTAVTGDPLAPAWYMLAAMLIGLAAMVTARETAPPASALRLT